MRVSHVIVTKARPEPLRGALESSMAALSSQDETIVVDGDPDRSARPLVEEFQRRHPQLRLRYVPSDPGMTLQRNVGIDVAEGDVVTFTDDDCTFGPTLFDSIAEVYGDPMVIGATGLVIAARPQSRLGSDSHSRLRWLLIGGGREGTMTSFGFRRPIVRVHQARDVEFMPGTLMSARRDIAAEVRFDERLRTYALGEDDDFSYRLSRRGRLRYEPSITVDHHEIGFRSMDRRARDRRQMINRTYLFHKNFSNGRRTNAAYALLVAMMFAHRVLNREWDGVMGLADGLGHVRRHGADAPDDTAGSGPAQETSRRTPSETSA